MERLNSMCMALSETKMGMKETEDDIRSLRDDLPNQIALELDEIWQKIKDEAISRCPKESGALASSIELESEGGSGITGATGNGATIYQNAIYAGNDSTFNFEGQPTSQYAQAVHDGHMLPNGDFWEGTPFLEDALDMYEDELNNCVNKAMDELGTIGDYNNPSTNALGDET